MTDEEFTRVVEDNQSRFLKAARRRLPSLPVQDAEDIVQRALERLWTRRSSFRGESDVTTWMIAAIYNEGLMLFRERAAASRKHTRWAADLNVADDESLEHPFGSGNGEQVTARKCLAGDDRDALDRELLLSQVLFLANQHLDPKMYDAVYQVYYVGRAWTEVAAELGMNVNTLKTLARRGLHKLRPSLRRVVRRGPRNPGDPDCY